MDAKEAYTKKRAGFVARLELLTKKEERIAAKKKAAQEGIAACDAKLAKLSQPEETRPQG